ncbi:MAG: hypothetical protein ACOCY1_03045 [Halovenus sp.]
MDKSNTTPNRRDKQLEKFYLTAVTVPTDLGRIEAFIQDRFDFHGVVLIPKQAYI